MRGLAIEVLSAEGLVDVELGIVVADDERLRDLNRRYAGNDAATDVLSFSLREGDDFPLPDEALRLGEVIISFETALRQARSAGRSTRDEIQHLLVHGILHLIGYDHAEPDDERRMRAREEELLHFAH